MRGYTLDAVLAELAGSGELALLDVRAAAVHSAGHLPRSVPAPLARLELIATRLIPRRSTPVILVGDANPDPDRLAMRAMGSLAAIGYRQIGRLEGGLGAGLAPPGRRLLTGPRALSLAFAEFLAARTNLRTVTARELAGLGGAVLVADLRPERLFRLGAVPGSLSAPGLELAVRALSARPDRPVVVVGAGRADSLMGALWLAEAGLGDRAAALDGGLAAWTAAGLPLEAGSDRAWPAPSAADPSSLAPPASGLSPVPVDWADIRGLREDASRNLLLFDLRPAADYRLAHPPGFRSVEGWRLLRSVGDYLAVSGATVVLHDDHGLRAALVAGWLSRMGWRRVRVLRGQRIPMEEGSPRDLLAETFRRYLADKIPKVGTEDALDLLEAGAVLVQVAPDSGIGPGQADRAGVLNSPDGDPVCRMSTRASLPRVLDSLADPGEGRLAILTSDDPLDAALAAAEMIRLGRPSLVLGEAGDYEGDPLAALAAALPRTGVPTGGGADPDAPVPADPDDGPEQLRRLDLWPELAAGRGPGGFGN